MKRYKNCFACGEVYETWELTEVYHKKIESFFEVCNKCITKHSKYLEIPGREVVK
jgi:protein-arginine kinase activator protein McsA